MDDDDNGNNKDMTMKTTPTMHKDEENGNEDHNDLLHSKDFMNPT